MDDVVNRFARELADAIAAAVAENPQVEACREKARAAGFEMKVTLEAVVGFVSRSQTAALTKVAAPARVVQPKRALDVTANLIDAVADPKTASDLLANHLGVEVACLLRDEELKALNADVPQWPRPLTRAPVAQRIEQPPSKRQVAGSIPAGRATYPTVVTKLIFTATYSSAISRAVWTRSGRRRRNFAVS